MIIRTTLIALFLIGCGSDDSSKPAEASKVYSLATTSADLPICTSENDKQLVYLEDQGEFVNCSNGSWSTIQIGETITETVSAGPECKNGGVKITNGEDTEYICHGVDGEKGAKGQQGEKGDQGQQGATGKQGEAGKDGEDGSNGLEVAEQWEYHRSSYIGSISVAGEAVNSEIYIGDIEITLMSNDHFYATISGQAIEINSGKKTDFTHSIWFTSGDLDEYEYEPRKIQSFADTRIGYGARKVNGVFVVSAVVDVDGNFLNNPTDVVDYTLDQTY